MTRHPTHHRSCPGAYQFIMTPTKSSYNRSSVLTLKTRHDDCGQKNRDEIPGKARRGGGSAPQTSLIDR